MNHFESIPWAQQPCRGAKATAAPRVAQAPKDTADISAFKGTVHEADNPRSHGLNLSMSSDRSSRWLALAGPVRDRAWHTVLRREAAWTDTHPSPLACSGRGRFFWPMPSGRLPAGG